MDDEKIIELYWRRDETAIACTDEKYGRLCRKISDDILSRRGDTQHQPEASAQPRRTAPC